MSGSDDRTLATTTHADLIFEVPPDTETFDAVRRAVVERLEADYANVMTTDLREHVRVDTVDMNAATWHVRGRLNDGHDITFRVRLRSDSDATEDVLAYLRDRLGDRYGGVVDPDPIVFERIGMRPSAWFVDAKVPPTPDAVDKDG